MTEVTHTFAKRVANANDRPETKEKLAKRRGKIRREKQLCGKSGKERRN
jgi:hypothetical protein